jgi:2-oxoisovalerate dehydrogenase E2 component (dihydrolipoyl transacylase)
MGVHVFKLPDVGEGVAEAEIVAWHVEVGDNVKEDQPLVDVMSDKATVEIGSPVAGKVLSRKGERGDVVPVGEELVTIATEERENEPTPTVAVSAEPTRTPPEQPVASVNAIKRVSERKPTAAPAVRTRAATLGIDLASIEGSGPNGQILHEDIDAVLLRRDKRKSAPASAARDRIDEIRIVGLRRQTARTMQEAKRRIPHFSYVEEVDVTALEGLRSGLNDQPVESRPKLTVLPFLIRGLVKALPDHPGINAHFDDENAVVKRYAAVHVGLATQTENGLVVPVIRHAETLDLFDIAREITRLSEAARAGKTSREELSGSTITISSLGGLGGVVATPIIKPPEVAIIAVNKIADRPTVHEGKIVIRKMMNLSSSFDHRVVDGFDAATFIQTVKAYLEAPARLLV